MVCQHERIVSVFTGPVDNGGQPFTAGPWAHLCPEGTLNNCHSYEGSLNLCLHCWALALTRRESRELHAVEPLVEDFPG